MTWLFNKTFTGAQRELTAGLVTQACDFIGQALNGRSRFLIAYSGGKDSLVVAHLLSQRFNVRDAVCETSFYFPFQLEEARRMAEQLGLRVVYRESLTLQWLSEHPQFIFSRLTKNRARFFQLRQQTTVAREARTRGVEAVFFGRRLEENSVKSPLYWKDGILQCHPLRHWKEQDIWIYLEQVGLPVPAIYHTPYGEDQGNGPWNIFTGSRDPQECWSMIYRTDPGTVRLAAQHIDSARQFLQSTGA